MLEPKLKTARSSVLIFKAMASSSLINEAQQVVGMQRNRELDAHYASSEGGGGSSSNGCAFSEENHAQHPATEVLSTFLPPELCRIICQFAAPYAPPVIATRYIFLPEEGLLPLRWRADAGIWTEYAPMPDSLKLQRPRLVLEQQQCQPS